MVTLNGKPYEVAYGRRARREMEAARGKGLMAVCQGGMVLDHATIIWGAIKHADRRLTIDQVADWIEGTDYDAALKECLRALFHAAPFGRVLDEAWIARQLDEEPEPGKAEAPTA